MIIESAWKRYAVLRAQAKEWRERARREKPVFEANKPVPFNPITVSPYLYINEVNKGDVEVGTFISSQGE